MNTNLKTSDITRKSLFAHRPKRFVMEDRPDFGGRNRKGTCLAEKKGLRDQAPAAESPPLAATAAFSTPDPCDYPTFDSGDGGRIMVLQYRAVYSVSTTGE